MCVLPGNQLPLRLQVLTICYNKRMIKSLRSLRPFLMNAHMKTNKLLITISASMIVLLSGCVVAPAGRPYYREPVMVDPPPPRAEYIGPPPVAGYIWTTGFWNWEGGRHQWVQGRWEAPRQGHAWVPHRWEQDGQHWRLNEGHWEPHGGDHREHQDERGDRR